MEIKILYIMIAIILIDLKNINKNISNLDKKLDLLLEDRDLMYDPLVSEKLNKELLSLLHKNKKIKAVKKLRVNTGMDLIKAKNYIDKLEIEELNRDYK